MARIATSRSPVALALLTGTLVSAAAVLALALIRHSSPLPFIAGIALLTVAAAFVIAALRTPVGFGSAIVAGVTVALWGGISLAAASWASSLLRLGVALVGAMLLVGLVSNLGRLAFAKKDGSWRKSVVPIAIALVLVVAAFGVYEGSQRLHFHAGHEAGACALPTPTSVTPTTKAASTAPTTTVPSAKRSVACVTVEHDSLAVALAIGGGLLLALTLLIMGIVGVVRWLKAKKRAKKAKEETAAKAAAAG